MKFQTTSDGIVLDLHVRPNSKEFRIESQADELLVFCRETPVKGRANRELIKELSKVFNRRVKIVSGITSRQKKIFIESFSSQEVTAVLNQVKKELQNNQEKKIIKHEHVFRRT